MLVGYDLDEAPVQPGWIEAMCAVMKADAGAGWLSIVSPKVVEALDEHKVPVCEVAGVCLRVPSFSLMENVVGWRVKCVRAMGAFVEPFAWYGGIETAMQPLCVKAGYYVGFMPDYHSDAGRVRALHDPIYERYKRRHTGHTPPIFPGSFEEFLVAEGVLTATR